MRALRGRIRPRIRFAPGTAARAEQDRRLGSPGHHPAAGRGPGYSSSPTRRRMRNTTRRFSEVMNRQSSLSFSSGPRQFESS
jgi:hypothetical protein